MTDTTPTPAVASRVTLDDVRAVLNGTDPHSRGLRCSGTENRVNWTIEVAK